MTPLTPSEEQQQILDLGLCSIKVRAGAGTGKTTTVAMIISNLIRNTGIEPEQVLGITFTNKAASELADRVRSAVGSAEPGRQAEVHTYHGFAAQVLSEFGALAGVDSRAKVITPTFSRQLMSETFHRTDYAHLDVTNTRALDGIRKLGDRLGDHLLSPQDILGRAPSDDVEAARREMAETLLVYNEEKRRLGLVDYADLVTLSTAIVTRHPELGRVIRDRYRVVVLDEYQDTNPAQRALLQAIFTEGFPVVAVGDEDQTIYEWRGASAENFDAFTVHFPQPDGRPAHLKTLTLNRRSTEPILAVANEVRRRANADPEGLVSSLTTAEDSEVVTFWAEDALQEAEWIARRFEELHEKGSSWKDMAVLFRKNKDFAMLVDVLGRHEIPLEVANIGGLLSVPEVAELRAWLTVLDRPEDGATLTQILFGSRYRLGLADIAPLVRMAATVEEGDDPEPISLIEALDRMDVAVGLRSEALSSLRHFADTYRRLLLESQGLALVEVCRLVLELTGAWRDVEALPPNPRLTARLNLYRFLDLAEDWSPLRGRPSLQAFLEYLDAMEEEPADELDSARLSGEDAVTLVTVHRAKGLEWETVALPAVTESNFPSRSSQYPNPGTVANEIPVDLRIDSVLADLPTEAKAARDFLRRRHEEQEWRVAYVAVTRAKRRLLVSGAHWYGLSETLKKPKTPSDLWELVDGLEVSSREGFAELGPRPEVLRLDEDMGAPDPHFPDGWAAGLRAALDDPMSVEILAERLGVADDVRALVDGIEQRLFALSDFEPALAASLPELISVTGLVTYAQCPKRYYWTSVDPLPRRHNPSATHGTHIHRRIELHQRGQVPLESGVVDVFDDEGAWGPSAFDTYKSSRFADERAALVEAPFEIGVGPGLRLRGRVDAIYEDGGRWEVVDFKSGRRHDDPSRLVQLQAYGLAAREFDFGIPPPESLRVTFAYLGGGFEEVSIDTDEAWALDSRDTIDRLAEGVAAEHFEETPGPWCNDCDFLRFCGPGKEYLG